MIAQKTEMFDEFGNPINATMVPDGGRTRTSFWMMDAAPADVTRITQRAIADAGPLHQPGSMPQTEATATARQIAYNERKAALSAAWANPPALEADAKPAPSAPVTDAAATADARYAARCAQLERAWQGA